MLGLSVIILFKSLLHVFCSLVFSAHNSSGLYPAHYPKEIGTSPAWEGLTVWREEELLGSTAPALPALGHRWVSGLPIVAG